MAIKDELICLNLEKEPKVTDLKFGYLVEKVYCTVNSRLVAEEQFISFLKQKKEEGIKLVNLRIVNLNEITISVNYHDLNQGDGIWPQ